MVSSKYILEVLDRLSKLDIQEAYQGNMNTINFTNENGVDYIKEFYKTLQPKELAKVEQNLKELKRLGMFAKPPLMK